MRKSQNHYYSVLSFLQYHKMISIVFRLKVLLLISLALIAADESISHKPQHQFTCGQFVHNLGGYPCFAIKGDPRDCGHPYFHLSCEDNRTVLYSGGSNSNKYYVVVDDRGIPNQNSIRLLDPAVQKNNCSTFPLYSFSEGYYMDGELILFVSCKRAVKSPKYIDTAPCLTGNEFSNQTTSESIYSYAVVGKVQELVASDIEETCTIHRSIKSPFPSLDFTNRKGNISFQDVHDAMAEGYVLSWQNYKYSFRHMNPMLQLCKRLASRGVMITLLTISSANILVQQQLNSMITIEYIKDYCNEVVDRDSPDGIDDFLMRFHAAASKNLAKVIEEKANSGYPVKVVLYDSLIPWALEIVHNQGTKGAAFFTQSCAVCAIYNHIHRGTLKVPLETSSVSLPSMPPLEANDLPSFVYDPFAYPNLLDLGLSQNMNLEKADWLLFNSFDKLENEVVSWLVDKYPIKTIGPSTPSMYIDKQLEDDKDYSLNLFKPSIEACMKWLDSKEINSVVYVSFGSLANLGKDQMEEIAWGLVRSNCNFLWVVRPSEENKIPGDLLSSTENQERGLIVNWCPQLRVLAHEALGCFMTHCGWNSTIEALSLGVPMVTMPVWIDQTTNSKFTVDVWRTGKQVNKGSKKGNIVMREDVEMVIKEVMYGEKSRELKSNALRWKESAKEAISEGGSSDKNIEEFVAESSLCLI